MVLLDSWIETGVPVASGRDGPHGGDEAAQHVVVVGVAGRKYP